MALPNGAGGYQLGDGNLNEVVLGYQAAPQSVAATATLAVGTGVSDGGNALVAVAVTASGRFLFRRTGDSTWVVYRV